MLSKVLVDLRIFLLFYVILIGFFSLIQCVIGISNSNYFLNEEYYKLSYFCQQSILIQSDVKRSCSYPSGEYFFVGTFIGNIIDTFRISLGDYSSVSSAIYLSDTDNYLYWLLWFGVVLIGCIIFLNFVIAEACHSYEVVTENLE